MPSVVLKQGHVQPVWSGHPWVYAQAVDRVEGGALAGDEVEVMDPRGNLLGRGYYSPASAIPVRILARDRSTPLNLEWFRERIRRAQQLRRDIGIPSERTTGYRLVHAEGDGLPGLVVDVFGEVLVVQLTTIGMSRRKSWIVDVLVDLLHPKAILDRTPSTHARTEGLVPDGGVIWGDQGVESLRFVERDLRYELPLNLGQKTGFYFDQRPLRGRVEQLARGRRVLDVCSYVGSFAMAAARGGATQVLAVDESALAMEVAARCASLNGLGDRIEWNRATDREVLTAAGQRGGYDLVIVDPPSLAPSAKAVARAMVTYQKLASAACRATRPGGLMIICTCSAAIRTADLTRALALGARDVGMTATILERMFQGADHPVPAAFGEGLYLKSLISRVEVR
ncbi:MAG TPA: class I SAM-dependent rRNA methyltransferase [Polyangiaceae bacterium]|nr:class I SAM-dependent rRNA methyltransferase [Polyangiaceae bacterium]